MSMCRVKWQFPKSCLQTLLLASRRLKILESWKGFGQCIKTSTTEETDSNIWVPVRSYSLWPHAFVVVVQSLSRVWLFGTAWTAACQPSLSFTISQGLLKLMFIELRMPSHPQSPPSTPVLNLSQHQGLFQWISSWYQVGFSRPG